MEFENMPLIAEPAAIDVSPNNKELRFGYKSSTSQMLKAAKSSPRTASIVTKEHRTPQNFDNLSHDYEHSNQNGNLHHHQQHKEQQQEKQKTQDMACLKLSMSAAERSATRKSLIILAAIFCTSLGAMCYVYMIFPELNESEKQHMKIPRDIQDAKMLAKVLDRYKDLYYFEVMFGVVIAYIFLQTFAIPGSLFLSILLGFLYRFPVALFLICICSAMGATLCYSLSNLVGRRLIRYYWPKKINEWSKHVEKHRDSLFNYMLFLRMTPILPNWFINLAAPVIGVPLYTFTLGTFFGVAPPSVLAIQTGKTLQKMSSSADAFSWSSMILLTICACLSILPGILKNKLKRKTK